MNEPTDKQERRLAPRVSLCLPVIVSGREADGAAWCEPTATDDISVAGAHFRLNRMLSTGDRLSLRSRLPDGAAIEATAEVFRTSPSSYGATRVGVRISEPAEGWRHLFISWSEGGGRTESSCRDEAQ